LKRLNVNNIPAIEEVNLFRKGDDTVIHFNQPRVQASIAANTYVVSGNCETKKVMDMLPSILPQLGPDNLENLKDMANQIQKLQKEAAGGLDDDDDEVPDLVENVNFEDVAAEELLVQDDDADEDDDDIPDLVETATFDDHVPIAVSTEPNPEDNAAPVTVSTEPNPEDAASVAVSTEPNPEDNAVSTESDSEENAAPVAVLTDPTTGDNVAAARSSEPEPEDIAAPAATAESDLKEDAEAAITKQNAEETTAANSEDGAVAMSTEPNPENNAATSSGDEDPIVAVSTEPNPDDSKGAKEDSTE